MPDEPVIVAARRTPIGTRGRALAALRVEELAAPVIRAVYEDGRAVSGESFEVADVSLGNCMGPGGNPARIAALAAGLGTSTTGETVDRQCGSGLASVINAAPAIRAGDRRARIAGGVESASTAPDRIADGVRYERAAFTPRGWPDPDMPEAAERLAQADGIGRARQDAHAARSHRRAQDARAEGRFAAELVPIGTADDDAIGGAAPLLPRLPPLFAGGSITAGTSTRISDGAAAALIVPRSLAPRAPGLLVRGHAVVGCDPSLPGIGAAPAVQQALGSAGLDRGPGLAGVAAFEIVEAFAAQSLAVLDRLGLDDADPRVCADGGALALGHPWGASGAVAVVRLFSRLVRQGAPAGSIGVAAASIGGGMGIALVLEVVR